MIVGVLGWVSFGIMMVAVAAATVHSCLLFRIARRERRIQEEEARCLGRKM
jgi:hypothetical protein